MLSNRLLLAPHIARSCPRGRTPSSLVRPHYWNAIAECQNQHFRSFQTLASSPSSTSGRESIQVSFHIPQHQRQQVRWMGRKSGASAFDPKPRRWSKKQKKRFRKKLEQQRELENHAPPGSKAGKRREYVAEREQAMIGEYQERLDGTYYEKQLAGSHPLQDPALEYTQEDALLDDLAGNTHGWGSQSTPEPIYYGDRQRAFYNRVMDQMDQFREEVKALPPGSPSPAHLLPHDKETAFALKAYRDQQGTRTKPIGIAKALQHVLKDLGIPSTLLFGEYTYNALLSCCRTPKEGIRVFELMQQHQHEISPYSWTILIDIHAKVGDFEGCVRVMDEMYARGHPPNMAAYTSLLAACYKVCNDGRIAHSIRAKAGTVGWEKWQELRIKGLDPDVMCYGAILRLCAARGQPEQCLNLLEEMPRFDVKPTTLCFSSALKAVAKSHETAIRYERGWSPKNKRRERIVAHHGKMARNIVLLAESAQVEIDDGFISALQLCAAAAGDSATAKAIYLADKVRRNMKHWRQVGSEEHLMRLRGEDPDSQHQLLDSQAQSLQLAGGDSSTEIASAVAHHNQNYQQKKKLSYGEREYGADTRTLSSILRACAQASESNGVGKMWSGRENYGYLDLTSLRLIQQYRKPQYINTDIPGMSRTEVGMGALVNLEDMQHPRKRTDPFLQRGARKKFPGVITLDDVGTGLNDLSDEMHDIYFDDDGMLKQEYIDTGLYPEWERIKENERRLEAEEVEALAASEDMHQIESGEVKGSSGRQFEVANDEAERTTSMYFCTEDRRWKSGHPDTSGKTPAITDSVRNTENNEFKQRTNDDKPEKEEEKWFFDSGAMKWTSRPQKAAATVDIRAEEIKQTLLEPSDGTGEGAIEEWYFDNDERRWKTRIVARKEKKISKEKKLTEFESRALEDAKRTGRFLEIEDGVNVDAERSASATTSASVFADDDEAETSFQQFFLQLKQEVEESGDDMVVDEEVARELFLLVSDEYSSGKLQNLLDEVESDLDEETNLDEEETDMDEEETDLDRMAPDQEDVSIPTIARGRSPPKKDFGEIMNELKEDWGDDGLDIDVDDWSDEEDLDDETISADSNNSNLRSRESSNISRDPGETKATTTQSVREMETRLHDGTLVAPQTVESYLQETLSNTLPDTLEDDFELEELKQLLPGMPVSRLKKVKQAYLENLSDPSLLTLVPILRETMPDWFTTYSLRAANFKNARFVMEKAEEADLIDTPMLNGMLQVYNATGSINSALALYEQFEKYKLKPTAYSNRLIVQMYLKQKRLSSCLAFKQKVEEQGQTLDLPSYGSLMEYCSRYKQLGSALMILKECISLHGAPPGENYLKELRTLCRHADLEEQVRLKEMIGEDPNEWHRHGEAVLKREKSKRGNRDINLVANAAVRC